MHVVLLRHASRPRYQDGNDEFREKTLPLTAEGKSEARALASQLARLRPEVYFTSCFAHARETGEILQRELGGEPKARVVELCTLTPHYQGPREWRGDRWVGLLMMNSIVREAEVTGNDLRALRTFGLILHKPRLAQLLAALTSRTESEFADLHYAEGICLKASSLDELLLGKGEQDGPVFSARRERS